MENEQTLLDYIFENKSDWRLVQSPLTENEIEPPSCLSKVEVKTEGVYR